MRSDCYTLLNIIGYANPGTIDSFKGEWSARKQRLVDDSDGFPYICNQLFYVSRAISEDVRAAFHSVNTLHFWNARPAESDLGNIEIIEVHR
jgi:hypothetical protein